MRRKWILVIMALLNISCASHIISENNESTKYSKIKSDYKLTDLNNYGCKEINSSVIEHILHTGALVTEKEIHDYYSTTGCSIKGSVLLNGDSIGFSFDYGGIMHFSNGEILGCSENCCTENYPYCSFDVYNLKGVR